MSASTTHHIGSLSTDEVTLGFAVDVLPSRDAVLKLTVASAETTITTTLAHEEVERLQLLIVRCVRQKERLCSTGVLRGWAVAPAIFE